jgi:hypothetical protein
MIPMMMMMIWTLRLPGRGGSGLWNGFFTAWWLTRYDDIYDA